MIMMVTVLMMMIMDMVMNTYQSILGLLVQHLEDSGMGAAHMGQEVGPHAVREEFRTNKD